ncbi:PIN domain-containing protein [bacterium]|nr:PIN domain-containing protein [bacterium]
MILVDANLLIYAYNSDSPHHQKAHRWLNHALLTEPRVALPWPSLLAYLRIIVNPRLFATPATLAEGWSQIELWLASPAAWIPQATERHPQILKACLAHISGPNGVPDAHLAALALEHGLVLHSADSGFARFPGLKWENPLA